MKSMQEIMNELGIKICPICGNEYEGHPALLRKDNKTEICSHCGMMEGVMAHMNESYKANRKSNSLYCIFEDKLCRFAENNNGSFTCKAPTDTTLKFICK